MRQRIQFLRWCFFLFWIAVTSAYFICLKNFQSLPDEQSAFSPTGITSHTITFYETKLTGVFSLLRDFWLTK